MTVISKRALHIFKAMNLYKQNIWLLLFCEKRQLHQLGKFQARIETFFKLINERNTAKLSLWSMHKGDNNNKIGKFLCQKFISIFCKSLGKN